MKRRWILVFFAAAIVGSVLHFLYLALPIALVSAFAPVNESVWEHLKLLFWPQLAASFILMRPYADKRRGWGAMLSGLLAAPAILLGAYYTLLSGFGVHTLALDIALYLLSMAAGFVLAHHLLRAPALARVCGPLVIAAGLYGAALVLFTFAPPDLPIFLSAS